MALRIFTAALFFTLFMGSFKAVAQTEEDVYYPEKKTYVDSLEHSYTQPYQSKKQPPGAADMKLKNTAPQKYTGFSAVLGYAGGFMIGYSLSSALFRQSEPRWGMLGVGAGLSFISWQLSLVSNRRTSSKTKDIYRSTSYHQGADPAIQLGYHAEGLGIQITF